MVDFREKLDKGVFVIFSKWLSMSTEKDLEKLVQEVGERIGGFRNKEKEIAYSLIASELGSEHPSHFAVISAAIAVAMSSMSMAISFKNDVGIVAIAALITTILFLVIILIVFIFSIKGSRAMYVNHAV